uniref:Uncharacterized protein n=1 Tax=Anopheles farauti TaxID=69004 RepID=A0A182Q7D8_9DIPT
MWYLVVVAVLAAVYLATRRWGRQLYYRWGRLIPFRRAIVNKSRPPTPPLIETTVPMVPGGGGTAVEESYPLLGAKEEYDDDRLHTASASRLNATGHDGSSDRPTRHVENVSEQCQYEKKRAIAVVVGTWIICARVVATSARTTEAGGRAGFGSTRAYEI